jgi:hypothetical protein
MTSTTSDGDFLRNWAAGAWDDIQLAQMRAIQEHLVDYAMHAWRPMSIEPPSDVLMLCACEEGLVLMMRTQLDAWRTSAGTPHKPPKYWMPAPVPPQK